MKITKEFIMSISANNAAIKNGADLVKKKNYGKLNIDKDQTFLSGECAGSGKNPYACSVDFINETAPVFRCSCPSRQIPCKHVIGLMWAFMEGESFTTLEIPEDIITKRENKEKRAIKSKEKLEESKKSAPKEKSAAWKKSALKKIEAQLIGIEEAEKILHSISRLGLGSMDSKNIGAYSGVIKQLDSYFISGIQNELNDLLGMIRYNIGNKDRINKEKKEQADYMCVVEKLCQISTMLVKAKSYLENKKNNPDKMDIESEIEELIGYAWKLEELAQYGLFETDTRLVELCFHVRQEDDKNQFVDEGFYVSLNSGKIYKTRNYRPFKASKHIKEEDSVFSVLHIPKLYIYPSLSLNPRVRWEEYSLNTFEIISSEVCKTIKAYAQSNFAETIKSAKNQLKNLLLFSHPTMLVNFAKISRISSTKSTESIELTENNKIENIKDNKDSIYGEMFAIYDTTGNTICLKSSDYCRDSFIFLLNRLTQSESENNSMLLLFDNDVESGRLLAQPLAIVTEEKIIRLVY